MIRLSTRDVQILGITEHPTGAFVTQLARNFVADLAGAGRSVKFLICDRDAKYTASLDEVFRSDDIRVVTTPVRSPRATSVTERWVRTVRVECLDQLLIAGHRHLERVLRHYVGHYKDQRPHRGIQLEVPASPAEASLSTLQVRRDDVRGGLIHEYYPRRPERPIWRTSAPPHCRQHGARTPRPSRGRVALLSR
ncbi:MAG: integrase core domain-containing protein [Acidimicrobiales bacterium]